MALEFMDLLPAKAPGERKNILGILYENGTYYLKIKNFLGFYTSQIYIF